MGGNSKVNGQFVKNFAKSLRVTATSRRRKIFPIFQKFCLIIVGNLVDRPPILLLISSLQRR